MNKKEDDNENQRKYCSVLVKVSIFSNTRASQSDTRIAWIVLQNIVAMYRDLKHQYTLQALIVIQNLKSPAYFFRPSYINRQIRAFQSSYKRCHPTYRTSKLVHCNCVITTRLDLIKMVTGTRWHAHIRYFQVKGCWVIILVREHHYCVQCSYSPVLVESFHPPCGGVPKHPLHSRNLLQHTQWLGRSRFAVRIYRLWWLA